MNKTKRQAARGTLKGHKAGPRCDAHETNDRATERPNLHMSPTACTSDLATHTTVGLPLMSQSRKTNVMKAAAVEVCVLMMAMPAYTFAA